MIEAGFIEKPGVSPVILDLGSNAGLESRGMSHVELEWDEEDPSGVRATSHQSLVTSHSAQTGLSPLIVTR